MANDRNSAIEVMHPRSDAAPARRTYVCLGVPRGGTSAVAGTMQRLGLFMGEDLPNNYEDPDFVGKPLPHMKEAVATRQAAHAIWGWKFPAAANYLENLLGLLDNPHLVVVTRDLVATMKAHRRWHNRGHLLAAHDIMLQQQRNWFLVERWKVPTAFVSYEKLILNPGLFIEEMAAFLSMPMPEAAVTQELETFLRPGSYK